MKLNLSKKNRKLKKTWKKNVMNMCKNSIIDKNCLYSNTGIKRKNLVPLVRHW